MSAPELSQSALSSAVSSRVEEVLSTLSEWQRDIAHRQLAQQPSRLHARLVAYLRNVADVEAFEATGRAASAAEQEADAVDPAEEDEESDGAETTAKPARSAMLVPTLTHTDFRSCMIDNMLLLLEEEWSSLFASCSTSDGKRISKHERHAKGLNESSLVYGEVTFHSFGEILWSQMLANLKPNGTFVDLGSGSGRGVLAASYLSPFTRLVGIEILEGLHQAAIDVYSGYESNVRSLLPATDLRSTQQIEFHCGSFLDLDWTSDVSLVFANSTCFPDALMDQIAEQGEKLRDGTYVVTFTKELSSPYFKLLYSEQHKMSWGLATVNIMIKVTPSPEEVAQAAVDKAKARERHNRRWINDLE